MKNPNPMYFKDGTRAHFKCPCGCGHYIKLELDRVCVNTRDAGIQPALDVGFRYMGTPVVGGPGGGAGLPTSAGYYRAQPRLKR